MTQELQSLSKAHSNISIVQLEVKDYASHGAVANKVADLVKERGVDVLINNAGMYNKVSLESGGPELIVENVEVNAVAPLYLTRALLPLLRQSAKRKASGQKAVVANISSKMGSLTDNTSGGHYAYRTSKARDCDFFCDKLMNRIVMLMGVQAAMNMVSKSLSVDLEPEGIRCVAVHPGWVQTDMGGPNALINTQTSVGTFHLIADAHGAAMHHVFLMLLMVSHLCREHDRNDHTSGDRRTRIRREHLSQLRWQTPSLVTDAPCSHNTFPLVLMIPRLRSLIPLLAPNTCSDLLLTPHTLRSLLQADHAIRTGSACGLVCDAMRTINSLMEGREMCLLCMYDG